jgi:DMATS type aromatic prenyltransferase
VAVDNDVDSRLKLFVHTPYASFASVREVLTLGGRIKVTEISLQQLRSLVTAVAGVDPTYPDEQDMPGALQEGFMGLPAPVPGFMYYFDIAPGSELPAIKLYIPMHHYGKNDLQLAKGITGWMKANGRGQYCDRYLRALENIADHRGLEEKRGIQCYVACLVTKSGEIDVTTYIDPEFADRVRANTKTYGNGNGHVNDHSHLNGKTHTNGNSLDGH